MKKLLLVAVVMMASLSTFAQREVGTLSLQPRVGISAADFNNTEDTKARVGFIAGAELEYYVSNMVGISAGMFYSQQGAEFEIGGADFTCKLDYVNVPIIANFYVWKGLALKAGLQPGFKMSSKLEGSYSGYAARLITYQEIDNACTQHYLGRGDLDPCNYILENTRYAQASVYSEGTWLETPRNTFSTRYPYVYYLDPQYRYISYEVRGGIYYVYAGARPVIEVPKTKISY